MILITGGAGFIGSHTAAELLSRGEELVICDNFSNSGKDVINKLKEITGKDVKFYDIDIKNKADVKAVFEKENIDSVIHFAAKKSVPESVSDPLSYYENNVNATVDLLSVMKDMGVKKLIYSSSAAIYGNGEPPYSEESPVQAVSPYGRTKIIAEEILKDLCASDSRWNVISLRYFNPLGAHTSKLIGENPKKALGNILPIIAKAAAEDTAFKITGADYDTPDGTGVRDYIHIMDLALGHYLALSKLKPGYRTYNLGGGTGVSVLELLNAFSEASGVKIKHEICERRPGDCGVSVADISLAKEELGFSPRFNINQMCKDAWEFYKYNKQEE